MNHYKIVLADDHVLVRQGLKVLLEQAKDIEVIGEARDGLELLELLKRVSPDMVILDIAMPNLRGIEATQEIKTSFPRLKVLMLTMHKDMELLEQALSAGVDGYLVKEDASKELFCSIETIRSGANYISTILTSESQGLLFKKYREKGAKLPIETLTTREREILKLVAEGKTSKEIAGLLFISPRTVEKHRYNIMQKLQLQKSVDLAKYAISKGYTSPNP
ncbi:MAG: response regulator transcription factor [Desulfobaccales bacterium]